MWVLFEDWPQCWKINRLIVLQIELSLWGQTRRKFETQQRTVDFESWKFRSTKVASNYFLKNIPALAKQYYLLAIAQRAQDYVRSAFKWEEPHWAINFTCQKDKSRAESNIE